MVGNKRGEIRKEVILRIIMLLLSALVLFPFLYCVAYSLSDLDSSYGEVLLETLELACGSIAREVDEESSLWFESDAQNRGGNV